MIAVAIVTIVFVTIVFVTILVSTIVFRLRLLTLFVFVSGNIIPNTHTSRLDIYKEDI